MVINHKVVVNNPLVVVRIDLAYLAIDSPLVVAASVAAGIALAEHTLEVAFEVT